MYATIALVIPFTDKLKNKCISFIMRIGILPRIILRNIYSGGTKRDYDILDLRREGDAILICKSDSLSFRSQK